MTKHTHFEEATDTRPSLAPSFCKTTECGHLQNNHPVKRWNLWYTRKRNTHLNVSNNPGSNTAPQLKYLTPSTSGVHSLNFLILSTVKLSNAWPSPPPFGSKSSIAMICGNRSLPIVAMKWSAKEDPWCGVAMVVIESTLNFRCVRCVVRYRQSRPPWWEGWA